MEVGSRRERVRRVSLAVMAVTAPLPVAGAALPGTGLVWAVLPATAGVVTAATMWATRVPAPIPAPPQYPARLVVAQVVPDLAPGPDLNELRALVAAQVAATGQEAVR